MIPHHISWSKFIKVYIGDSKIVLGWIISPKPQTGPKYDIAAFIANKRGVGGLMSALNTILWLIHIYNSTHNRLKKNNFAKWVH